MMEQERLSVKLILPERMRIPITWLVLHELGEATGAHRFTFQISRRQRERKR